jgi:hypothetical protein
MKRRYPNVKIVFPGRLVLVTDLFWRTGHVDECGDYQHEQQQHPVELFSPALTHLEDSFPCVEEYGQLWK